MCHFIHLTFTHLLVAAIGNVLFIYANCDPLFTFECRQKKRNSITNLPIRHFFIEFSPSNAIIYLIRHGKPSMIAEIMSGASH